ncbi:MAG: TadA family conjugal transfer-associated ATPase [Actinocatenispora sp.]
MTAVERQLADRVRHRLARSGRTVTPAAIVTAVREECGAALGDSALLGLAEGLRRDLTGAGPLEDLLADPMVTDVLVNGTEVWCDRGAGLQRAPVAWTGHEPVRRLAQRLAAQCGRALDDAHPFVDGRLADGTRLHAVLPPVAADGPCLALRTFRQRAFTLDELVTAGTLTDPLAELLHALVAARFAYLVTGGTGSGKTTLLAALLSLVPGSERVVVVEDAAELHPEHPHVVALTARHANVEGAGEITLRELVRQALRMRPDRIVVGECRGAEVAELLAALNTGHDGGAGTLHANAPADVPARLEALGQLGGLTREALHAQLRAALQVVLHLRRLPGGRVLDEVCLLAPESPGGPVATTCVWRRGDGTGPAAPVLARMLADRGVPAPSVLRGLSTVDESR